MCSVLSISRCSRCCGSARLPDYFGAVDGITDDGTPIGNLGYAGLCFMVAALCVLAAVTPVAAGIAWRGSAIAALR